MSIFSPKKEESFWLYGIGGGLFEAAYCFFIAILMISLAGMIPGPEVFSFLLLLLIMVFSAAISGILIFGYPLYLALKKQYQEAIFTALLSIATLIVLGLIIIFIYIIF